MINEGYLCDYNIHIPIFSGEVNNINVCTHLIQNYNNIIIYCSQLKTNYNIELTIRHT